MSVKKLIRGDKSGTNPHCPNMVRWAWGLWGTKQRRKLHNLRAEKAKPSIFRGDYESCNATAPLYNFMYCEIIMSLAWSKILKHFQKYLLI